jgi:RES domain-containing protein
MSTSKVAMTTLWRIAATTPSYNFDDMTGEGAKRVGGRWNSVGVPLTYSSGSIALAALETLVHLSSAPMFPANRYLVEISVPTSVFEKAEELKLAMGWNAVPHGMVSIKTGDLWAASIKTLLAKVPSSVIPEEFNYLINPLHPESSLIKVKGIRSWTYDPRLKSKRASK